ncbi:MAG: Gfo/Idh/MocA family oxidoreductase [Clostridiaceae bacterium]|nr:Gfo/Idh/MocA family oxidoreductase [Clostridiaceae bacterium]
MNKVKLVLVGIGGYGDTYVRYLRERLEKDAANFTIEGIVDPFAAKAPSCDWVQKQGYPIYDDLESFYAEKTADLALIATPIPLHRPQSVYAMEHGSHVLVEKPLCPTIQDAVTLQETSERTGKFLAVGFQWSFSQPVLELKRDILVGKLGQPVYMKAFVSWKRFLSYYNHTWKGKYRDNRGNWILDCVITNATAHYLHNLFFVGGAGLPEGASLSASAMPERVLAEAYRVKPDMETPDVFALRGELPGNVPFWYGCSYSLTGDQTTRFEFAYENALVRFNEDEKDDIIHVTFRDGTTKDYGDPQIWEETSRKIQTCIDAAASGDRSAITCVVGSILPHLKVTDGMFDLIPEQLIDKRYLVDVPNAENQKGEDHGWFANTLRDDLLICYGQMKLPSELSYAWTCPAVEFRPAEVTRFDGSRYL